MGRKSFNLSTTSIYFCIFILIANELIFAHAFEFLDNDEHQNQIDSAEQDALRQLLMKYITFSEHPLSEEINMPPPFEPNERRRFCCMNPLGGRKRSLRNLARKKQQSHIAKA